MRYPIHKCGKEIGFAYLSQCGMQYLIKCECNDNSPYRIIIRQKDRVIDLGLPVPDGKKRVLLKRIAKKEIDFSDIVFEALDPCLKKGYSVQEIIDKNMIKKLPDAVLHREVGGVMICFKVQNDNSSMTGQ